MYSGVPLYLPTKENNKQRLYGSRQMTINQSKTSGTEIQHWAINSLSPVTAYFCKCLSRFSSGLAWELLSACSSTNGGSFSTKPRQHLLFLYLRTRNLAKCYPRYSEMSSVHSCHWPIHCNISRVKRETGREMANIQSCSYIEKCHLSISTAKSAYWLIFIPAGWKNRAHAFSWSNKAGLFYLYKKLSPQITGDGSFSLLSLRAYMN